MGLEKAIKYGKEKRREYKDSRRVDHTCRNHGSCPWCERNRKHFFRKEEEKANDKLKEYIMGGT